MIAIVKKISKGFLSMLDSMARARAASTFTRMGRYDLAKQIMLKD